MKATSWGHGRKKRIQEIDARWKNNNMHSASFTFHRRPSNGGEPWSVGNILISTSHVMQLSIRCLIWALPSQFPWISRFPHWVTGHENAGLDILFSWENCGSRLIQTHFVTNKGGLLSIFSVNHRQWQVEDGQSGYSRQFHHFSCLWSGEGKVLLFPSTVSEQVWSEQSFFAQWTHLSGRKDW